MTEEKLKGVLQRVAKLKNVDFLKDADKIIIYKIYLNF